MVRFSIKCFSQFFGFTVRLLLIPIATLMKKMVSAYSKWLGEIVKASTYRHIQVEIETNT